jgi:flagellar capping protein FliD
MQGIPVMDLTEDQLHQIGEYIRNKLPDWATTGTATTESVPVVLLERIVRVEEELKNQRELMMQYHTQTDKRFEDLIHQMDKRFEQVDKRFEQMDRRFDDLQSAMNRQFLVVSSILGVLTILVGAGFFFG